MAIYDTIYKIIEMIPEGSVATYGQIAEYAGCTARQVGYALSALLLPSPIPWHRVINSKGQISVRNKGNADCIQRDLLEQEGVVFIHGKTIDLERYRWQGCTGLTV